MDNNCWMCKEINNGGYKSENTHKTLKLKIYKEHNGKHLIQADGEDVLQQEIVYCPICRSKVRRKSKMWGEIIELIPLN